jgi:hypothetical protein
MRWSGQQSWPVDRQQKKARAQGRGAYARALDMSVAIRPGSVTEPHLPVVHGELRDASGPVSRRWLTDLSSEEI